MLSAEDANMCNISALPQLFAARDAKAGATGHDQDADSRASAAAAGTSAAGEEHCTDDVSDLRKQSTNTMSLALALLKDRTLFYSALVIHAAASPLRSVYARMLQAFAAGPQSTAEWFARRSSGSLLAQELEAFF